MSPTCQPVDAVPDGGDGAAALHAEDVGGPGRRRVEALPLQQVGPVEPGRGDVEHDLARSGLRVGPLPDEQDLGSAGSVSHHSAHGASLGRASVRPRRARRCGRRALSSGTSSSMSSGSGAVAGRSQPSASACARAGQALHLLGVRVVARGREAEEVRRHRRRQVLDVVGRDLRQVGQQALVDLGLDVEDVAELVDPVVEVHGSTVTPQPGESQAPSGELVVRTRQEDEVADVRPGVDVAVLVADSTARRRGRGGSSSGCSAAPCCASWSGRTASSARGRDHERELPPAVGSDEHGAVAAGRRVPQPPEGRRGEVRHVAGQHREPAAGPASSASRPVSSAATGPPCRGSSRVNVTGRSVGTGSPTTTTSPASITASSAQAEQRPAAVLDRGLVDTVEPGRGAAGEHHGVEGLVIEGRRS